MSQILINEDTGDILRVLDRHDYGAERKARELVEAGVCDRILCCTVNTRIEKRVRIDTTSDNYPTLSKPAAQVEAEDREALDDALIEAPTRPMSPPPAPPEPQLVPAAASTDDDLPI